MPVKIKGMAIAQCLLKPLTVFFLVFGLAVPGLAITLESLDPVPATYDIQARVRNGNTGYEAVLFTPGDPAPGTAATQLNPPGSPVWKSGGNRYGDIHTFLLTYQAATGTATWSVDFNRDGDFLDAKESTGSISPSLVNHGFRYVNIWGQGKAITQRAELQSVTINGQVFGPFVSDNNMPFSRLFTDSTGFFTDLHISGQFLFSGAANSEIPRIWVQLATPVETAAGNVPLPGGILLLALGMLRLISYVQRQRDKAA